ncbi:hypothetical protein Hdeb2414_s0008g00265001 [Helianthus debilis subsp. tardiflorus]
MRMRVPELNGHCMILLKAIFWFNKALFEIVELKAEYSELADAATTRSKCMEKL